MNLSVFNHLQHIAIADPTAFNECAVIKFGGSAIADNQVMSSVIEETAHLVGMGLKPVIVHGGGPSINQALEQSGIAIKKISGLRVTDSESLVIIEKVLNEINHKLIAGLKAKGIKATSLSGQTGNVLKTHKLWLFADYDHQIDLGWVGNIQQVNIQALKELLDANIVPVMTPLGFDDQGNLYNINADHAATAVAKALWADKLIFLSDVDGVLSDMKDPSTRIAELTADEIPALIANKIIQGGMLPKIESCLDGIKHGIGQIQIVNGRREQSLLKAFLTPAEVGTTVKRGASLPAP